MENAQKKKAKINKKNLNKIRKTKYKRKTINPSSKCLTPKK